MLQDEFHKQEVEINKKGIQITLRLHQNYLRRKANGKYREYEERTKVAKRAEMDAKKDAIRAEDMKACISLSVLSKLLYKYT